MMLLMARLAVGLAAALLLALLVLPSYCALSGSQFWGCGLLRAMMDETNWQDAGESGR